jgi:RNA polymerase sigma-70 factor, ECF subfamily
MSPTAPKDGDPATPPMNAERPQGGGRPLNVGRGGASERRAPHAPDEDLELVRRTQAGDRAAFRALFDKYHRRVFAIALGVVKNQQDANDVTQEAFVKVYRHIEGFEGASSFYTWLYRITMNLSIDLFRRRKTARQVDYDDAVGRDDDDLADPAGIAPSHLGGDPSKAQSRKELVGKLTGALETLPPIHQQVLILREVDGLSYEEIAQVTQIPKGTVMSRLFHARRKMQAALAGYVEGELTPKNGEVDE